MRTCSEYEVLPPELLRQIMADRKIRTAIVRESHFLFFNIYFADQVQYETAEFQREMFALTEDVSIKNIFIEAFRGSAKSTILNTSLALWSVLGKPQNKFILILGQTQEQARHHLKNIRMEIERNELLRSDLGPFQEEEDEWKSQSLIIPRYGAKLMAVSADQAVRGFRFGKHRPDLIIADDLEDSQSVRTRESREKIYYWLIKEIIPAATLDARIVVIGNLLHDAGLLRRLQREIEDGTRDGIYRRYPLIDSGGQITWPGKYPSEEVIEKQRKQLGNEIAWQQEYLLNYTDYSDRVIHHDWVQFYEKLPDVTKELSEFRYIALAIDPAISEKQTADFTAMVSAIVCGWDNSFRIYILPFPVNERMDHPKTVERIKTLYTTLLPKVKPKIYIEEVAYQAALVQRLQQEEHLPAEGVKIVGIDKRARLSLISSYIKNGTVLFPKRGAEALIQQLVGFGNERHDDLADAFTLLITKITEGRNHRPGPIRFTQDSKPFTAGLWKMKF